MKKIQSQPYVRMKREQECESGAEAKRACASEPREARFGITAFRSGAQPCHPTGIFQARFADFHVRELSLEDCSPLAITALPSGAVPQAEYIRFVMYKENRTTADALQQLASASGCPLSAFSIAGSKDKRAITVQQVHASGLRDTSKLLKCNLKWTSSGSRVRVAHFAVASRALDLSCGQGNHFAVVLRELSLQGDSKPSHDLHIACDAVVRTLETRGFINYFGLQRFGGNGPTPTHEVGAALLLRQHSSALRMILSPGGASKPTVRAALEVFASTMDAQRALDLLPPRGGAASVRRLLNAYRAGLAEAHGTAPEPTETAALRALRAMPRRQMLLYLNALQALAFNRAASARLERLDADHPVVGDLVWDRDESAHASPAGEGAGLACAVVAEIADDPTDDADVAEDDSTPAASLHRRAALPPPVRYLSAEDVASGQFTMHDVLLPLPGHSVTYPQHTVAEEYARTLESCGLPCESMGSSASTGNANIWCLPELFDLPGCYRPLIAFAADLQSDIIAYDDHTVPLVVGDMDQLEPRTNPNLSSSRMAKPEPGPLVTADMGRLEPGLEPQVAAGAIAGANGRHGPEEEHMSSPKRWAWLLRFSLPPSVYATMLLREALHEPLLVEEHTRRAKESLGPGLRNHGQPA